MRLRAALPLALAAGMVVLFAVGLKLDATKIPSPFVGKPAPPLESESLFAGAPAVSLTGYAGKAVAVNVWGTWCQGCRVEHPVLMQIAADGTIPLLGINWRDERQPAQAFLERFGNPYRETAFDPQGDVAIDWGVYGAPETFLVSPQGQVVYKHIGPLDWATWQTEFVARLAASPAPEAGP